MSAMDHNLNDQLDFEKKIGCLSSEELAHWTAREVYFASQKLTLVEKRMGSIEQHCLEATQAGVCTNGSVFTPKGKKIAMGIGIPSGLGLAIYSIIEMVKALKG